MTNEPQCGSVAQLFTDGIEPSKVRRFLLYRTLVPRARDLFDGSDASLQAIDAANCHPLSGRRIRAWPESGCIQQTTVPVSKLSCTSAADPQSLGLSLTDFTLHRKYDKLTLMTPLTKNQVFEIISRLEAEIRALGVSRLAVFGSVARGEARPDSDVDILVQFSPGSKTYDRFLALSELLEANLGRRIELITTEALSPFIGSHILAEAQDVIRAS